MWFKIGSHEKAESKAKLPFLSRLILSVDKVPDYNEFCLPFNEELDKSICEMIMQSNNPVYTPEMKAVFHNMMLSMQPDGIVRSKWRRRGNGTNLMIIFQWHH